VGIVFGAYQRVSKLYQLTQISLAVLKEICVISGPWFIITLRLPDFTLRPLNFNGSQPSFKRNLPRSKGTFWCSIAGD
jgi:hypothetical protein